MVDACLTQNQPVNERFRKRVDIPEKRNHHHAEWNFLQGSRVQNDASSFGEIHHSGTHTTRFKKGFQRRREEHIPKDEARIQYSAQREFKQTVHADRRMERLRDKTNSYDLITGAKGEYSSDTRSNKFLAERAHVRMDKLTPETASMSAMTIRDSSFRFFEPQTTGKNADQRREKLVNEGMTQTVRCSSVLGVGRAEVPSHGVHDQFVHADYGDSNFRPHMGVTSNYLPRTTTTVKSTRPSRDDDIAAVRALP
mmetsp:Transcript_21707/g.29518  ORF Transcript_21707/g.29518 Transcript_21707/m.29518 type:complete len:253 (-) Transcript_21707:186-944(-)